MSLSVASVTAEHIEQLAATMQEVDKQSILLLTGMSPAKGLEESVGNSLESQTWMVDGVPVAMSGIGQTSLLADWACPWLLCSDSIRKVPRVFLEATREQTYQWLETYGILRNVTWCEHKRSLKWLKWLGFSLYGPYPVGIDGAMFFIDELKVT